MRSPALPERSCLHVTVISRQPGGVREPFAIGPANNGRSARARGLRHIADPRPLQADEVPAGEAGWANHRPAEKSINRGRTVANGSKTLAAERRGWDTFHRDNLHQLSPNTGPSRALFQRTPTALFLAIQLMRLNLKISKNRNSTRSVNPKVFERSGPAIALKSVCRSGICGFLAV